MARDHRQSLSMTCISLHLSKVAWVENVDFSPNPGNGLDKTAGRHRNGNPSASTRPRQPSGYFFRFRLCFLDA